jgi:hypothetical protein
MLLLGEIFNTEIDSRWKRVAEIVRRLSSSHSQNDPEVSRGVVCYRFFSTSRGLPPL